MHCLARRIRSFGTPTVCCSIFTANAPIAHSSSSFTPKRWARIIAWRRKGQGDDGVCVRACGQIRRQRARGFRCAQQTQKGSNFSTMPASTRAAHGAGRGERARLLYTGTTTKTKLALYHILRSSSLQSILKSQKQLVRHQHRRKCGCKPTVKMDEGRS